MLSRKGTKRIAYSGDDRRETTPEEEENQSQIRPDDCGVNKRRRRTSPLTPIKTLKPQKRSSPSPKNQVEKVPPLQLTSQNC